MTRVAPMVPADTDLLCEGCGYTLTGLPEGSNCPECGRSVASSVGLGRKPPDWEIDPSARGKFVTFLTTTAFVLFRPTRFYRGTTVRGRIERARAFAMIHWLLSACLFTVAAYTHATLYHSVGFEAWMYLFLGGPWGMPVVAAAVYLVLDLTTRLAGRLTAWEAAYRGIRLPLWIVLRGMYYHAAHYLPVALLATGTVLGYALLNKAGIIDLTTVTTYLYVLCGEVVIAAAYLFHTYWIGMRNMMYANR